MALSIEPVFDDATLRHKASELLNEKVEALQTRSFRRPLGLMVRGRLFYEQPNLQKFPLVALRATSEREPCWCQSPSTRRSSDCNSLG